MGDCRQIQAKLYVDFGWLFDDISGSMWLEELASESNIIQAQEIYVGKGRLHENTDNYIWVCDGLSSISLDQCVRLASRLL